MGRMRAATLGILLLIPWMGPPPGARAGSAFEEARERLARLRALREAPARTAPAPRRPLAPEPVIPLRDRRPELDVRAGGDRGRPGEAGREGLARGLEHLDRLMRSVEFGDRFGLEDAFSRGAFSEAGIFGFGLADDRMRETAIRVDWHLAGYFPDGPVPAARIRWNRSATDLRTGVPRVDSGEALVSFDPEDDYRIRSWTGTAPFGRTDPSVRPFLRGGQP